MNERIFVALWVSYLSVFLLTGCSDQSNSTVDSTQFKTFKTTSSTAIRMTDWPNLYGPDYGSVSTETDLALDFEANGPAVLWKRPIGKGYSAPVLRDGKLILISRHDDREVVECVDAETGNPLWEFDYPTDYDCSFEYSNGPYATPVIGKDAVVTVGAQGQFHCLDLTSGKTVWSRNLLRDYNVPLKEWPVTTSPLLVDDRIIFNLGAVEQSAGIVALDIASGEVLWESTDHGFSHASPIAATIHDRLFVFAMTDKGLVCLDPVDGNVHWEVPHRIRQSDRYNAVTPVVYEDRVCIVTGPSVKPGFRCFQVQPDGSFREPWKNIRLLNSQYTNLVVVNGHLFGFTPVKQGGPELVCIDLEQGKHAWKTKPGIGRGNLLAVEDRLLILGEDGTLAVYELNGAAPKEVARTERPVLKRPCYTSMALGNGLLYARNERQIVCLNLRRGDRD